MCLLALVGSSCFALYLAYVVDLVQHGVEKAFRDGGDFVQEMVLGGSPERRADCQEARTLAEHYQPLGDLAEASQGAGPQALVEQRQS